MNSTVVLRICNVLIGLLIGFPILQPLTGVTPLQYTVFATVGFGIPVLTVWLLARQRSAA